ncbi:plastocyanin/azurin family copper-binding protein [Haloarcula sp. GH36]|uniref:plastocyanin/azurin family copper-binding protein n=1 Tax=Haloarcula montana TaxID=3111776 RepID=UPI002D78C994|nr:plastocyanin/azurin family copper-binding protein [Haloarcula sp. GH36]
MERRAYLRAVGAVTAAGLAGCIGTSGTSAEYDIGMSARAFRPETIEVAPGAEVVWRNTSKQGHSVTAYESGLPEGADYWASGGFDDEESAREAWGAGDGGTLFEGQSYSHTFEIRGEYPYFCIPHERGGMVGTVVVTDDPSTTTG